MGAWASGAMSLNWRMLYSKSTLFDKNVMKGILIKNWSTFWVLRSTLWVLKSCARFRLSFFQLLKPGCHLRKKARKCVHIYVLAEHLEK
jgi:hypothetical protein